MKVAVKRISLLVFIHLSVVLSACLQIQARPLQMVTSSWPPYYSADLPKNGFLTALVAAAFKAVDQPVTVRFVPWKRAMVLVEKTEADILLGVRSTADRRQTFLFSDVVYYDEIVFIARKTVALNTYNSLRDLQGYTIGVGRGFAYQPDFDRADFLNKVEATNYDDNIRKLVYGRLDMVAGSKAPNLFALKQLVGPSLGDFKILKPPLNRAGLHIAVSRDLENGEQIIADFNRGLKQILSSGAFDAILLDFGQTLDNAPGTKSSNEVPEKPKV